MKLVSIESPLKAPTPERYEVHRAYAKACMRNSLALGESPFAMHLLFAQPHILDDTVPEERERGIAAGLAWAAKADLVAVYTDLGVSEGMNRGIARAEELGIVVVYRKDVWRFTPDVLAPEMP